MKEILKQQGNQADKLLSQVFDELSRGGISQKAYILTLDENNIILLNSGVDITVPAKGLNAEYESIIIKSADSEYSLRKTTTFNSSSVFSAVMSLSSHKLSMLIAYITSDSAFLQICYLPLNDKIAVPLEIGDSEEIKRANMKILKETGNHFFTAINYGYGVGTYQSGVGGFAHVTTAYGNEVFYDISKDGAVIKNELYIKPNDPYTVNLNASDIEVELDDIKSSKVLNAGELIISGPTGLITYTRAADSTDSAIYFTDNRKDGKLAILTYNPLTKIITSSIV
nr:MAG TPA: Head fiber protein [Caudoviricetes sp.]